MDLFREVRERVSMEEAVRRYGFEPDRQHKIRCPFHEDEHPSLQLYQNGRGWWCYVCDSGGSVIDFVSRLYRISGREAALKLNQDFSLGLTAEAPRKLETQRRNHERFLQDREKRVFREEYARRQEEFIRIQKELCLLSEGGGRIGRLLGWRFILEEWFQENPWR